MPALSILMRESADKIRVETGQRFDRQGFDLIVNDRTANLSKSAEDTLDNHLITFVDFQLSKTYHLQCTGLVLQQKAIGRLPLTIGG